MRSARVSLSLFAFALTLSGCQQKIPNIKACSVAGLLSDGAECAWTLEDRTESLTLFQVIDMLEPKEDPPRAGAIILPAEDFMKLKIFIEQACRRMPCKAEVTQALDRISRI